MDDRWNKTTCFTNLNHIEPKEEVKVTRTKTFIYCLKKLIWINQQKKECPPYVFSVKTDLEWKTDLHSWATSVNDPKTRYENDIVGSNWSSLMRINPHHEDTIRMMDKISELINLTESAKPTSINNDTWYEEDSAPNGILVVLTAIGITVVVSETVFIVVWIKYNGSSRHNTVELQEVRADTRTAELHAMVDTPKRPKLTKAKTRSGQSERGSKPITESNSQDATSS